MPYIAVEIVAGRSEEQLAEFARRVTDATVDVLGAARERVHVRFFEHERSRIAIAGALLSAPAEQ